MRTRNAECPEIQPLAIADTKYSIKFDRDPLMKVKPFSFENQQSATSFVIKNRTHWNFRPGAISQTTQRKNHVYFKNFRNLFITGCASQKNQRFFGFRSREKTHHTGCVGISER